LSLGFQALYVCSRSVNTLEPAVYKDGHAQCTENTSREPGTVVEPQEDHTFLSPLSP